jgi:hypothetical protein
MRSRNTIRSIALGLVLLMLGVFVLLSSRSVQAAIPSIHPSADPVAASHGLPLDHFKCYPLDPPSSTPVNATVLLVELFDLGTPEQVTVGVPFQFCNPVEKKFKGNVTPINNPLAHLTFYALRPPTTGRVAKVVFQNQFGRKSIKLAFPSIALAVPTAKLSSVIPGGLDHFECYIGRGKRPTDASGNSITLKLKDQFGRQKDVAVGPSILWCNPAAKAHNGVVTGIDHPNDYLVCYLISVKNINPVAPKILNQFGFNALALGDGNILCVPAAFVNIIALTASPQQADPSFGRSMWLRVVGE